MKMLVLHAVGTPALSNHSKQRRSWAHQPYWAIQSDGRGRHTSLIEPFITMAEVGTPALLNISKRWQKWAHQRYWIIQSNVRRTRLWVWILLTWTQNTDSIIQPVGECSKPTTKHTQRDVDYHPILLLCRWLCWRPSMPICLDSKWIEYIRIGFRVGF